MAHFSFVRNRWPDRIKKGADNRVGPLLRLLSPRSERLVNDLGRRDFPCIGQLFLHVVYDRLKVGRELAGTG